MDCGDKSPAHFYACAMATVIGSRADSRLTPRESNRINRCLSVLAVLAVVLLALALRILAWSPLDASHPDELMQYAEQANRLATGHGIVPWESRVGLRNSLIPQLLLGPVWLGRHFAPGTMAGYYLGRAFFEALTLLALPGAWLIGRQVSRTHALAALFVVATWWESVLMSSLLLSESLASALLLLAFGLLLDDRGHGRQSAWGGFLLGLGVLVRFQYGPMAAIVLGAALWRRPESWKAIATGLLGAALLGAASDLAAGAVPYSWFFINLAQNIGAGRAAGFGTSPFWRYLLDYYLHFGAAALIVLVGCALASGRRFAPLLVAAFVNVALLSLVAHKEFRFVWLSTLILLVLAAIGSLKVLAIVLERHVRRERLEKATLLCALAAWGALSLVSYRITGGYPAFREDANASRLAIEAANDPRVCRLVVTRADWLFYHAVPALLPRALPLSIAPFGVTDRERPLPPALARSANALLMKGWRPLGSEAYRKIRCLDLTQGEVCLYIRPGTCQDDPTYNFQKVLEEDNL